MNIQETLGGPFGQRLAWTLLHFLWQGFAISAVTAAAAWLLPPTQTRGRYMIALTGLVLMACSVLLTFGVLHVDSPHPTAVVAAPDLPVAGTQPHAPPQVPPRHMAAFPLGGLPLPAESVSSLPSADPVPAAPAEPSWQVRLSQAAVAIQPYAIAAWLAGIFLLSGRLLASLVGVRRLARGRLPVSAELAACAGRLAQRLGLSGPPGLCLSQRVREAMLVGLWRPMVLLPVAWIAEMPPDVLEAVIAHELAHVRRLDLWANLLQRLVETLLFYHPAVWWLSRRASLLREMCADELAVQATGQPMSYAGALEHLGRLRLKLPTPQLAAGIGGRRTALFDRIRNVLGVAAQGERLRWWPAGIMTLLASAALWLVSIAVAQSQPQPAAGEKAASPELPPPAAPGASSPRASQPDRNSATAANVHIPTMRQISAAWTMRQKRVRSAKLQWKETQFIAKGTIPRALFNQQDGSSDGKEVQRLPPTDASLECRRSVIINDKMLRMDSEGADWHPQRGDLEQESKVCTTDGEVAKTFFDERTNDQLVGSVENEVRNPEYNCYLYWPIAYAFRPCDPEMGGLDLKICAIGPRLEIVDGRSCIVLSAPRMTLWLDPQCDFVVVKVREELGGRTCDIAYREDPSHVWVPVEWKLVTSLGGKVRERIVAKATSYTLNADIPRSAFQFEFPVGTNVSDLRYEDIERYIVRPGGKKRLITEEELRREAGAVYQELLRTESGKARGVPAPQNGNGRTKGNTDDRFITGLVVDEKMQPIEGAEFRIYTTNRWGDAELLLRSTLTDKQGKFRLDRPLENKPATMTISKPGFGSFVEGFSDFPFKHGHKGSLPWELGRVVLTKAASLRGRVTGPEGQPVAGAEVWVPYVTAPTGIESAKTDANGYYEISDLIPWRAMYDVTAGSSGLSLRVQHADYGFKMESYTQVPGTVNFAFAKPAVVTGRIVGQAKGKPLGGVVVRLFNRREHGYPWSEASSDDQGRFRLVFQGAGTCTLEFHTAPGKEPAVSIEREREIEIARGVQNDLGTILVDLDAPLGEEPSAPPAEKPKAGAKPAPDAKESRAVTEQKPASAEGPVETIYRALRSDRRYSCPAFSIEVKSVDGRKLERVTMIIKARGDSSNATITAEEGELKSEKKDVLKVLLRNGRIEHARHSLAFPDSQELDIPLSEANRAGASTPSANSDMPAHLNTPAGANKPPAAVRDAAPKSQEPPGKAAGWPKETPAAKPPDKQTRGKDGTSTNARSSELESPPGFLILPAYLDLAGRERRQRYGIDAAQEKRLQNIADAYHAAMQRIREGAKEFEKLPPDERKAKLKELQTEYRQAKNNARNQITDVLTPKQRADYLRDVRYNQALWFCYDPRPASLAMGIELSQQQREQFDRLEAEDREEYRGNSERIQERLLAVLTPQQRERLLARFTDSDAALLVVLPPSDVVGINADAYKSTPPPLDFSFISKGTAMVIVYQQLSDPAARKGLALTADQEARLQAVLVKSGTAAQEIFNHYEAKTTTPKPSREAQESQRAEYRRALEQFGKGVITEIEAVLQPQQVAALKAIARKNVAQKSLWQHDRAVLDDLHANRDQRAKLWEIYHENAEPNVPTFRARGEKALAILTPQQRKKLEDFMARIP